MNNKRMVTLSAAMLVLAIASALVIQVALAQPDTPANEQGGAVRTQAAATAQALRTQVATAAQAVQTNVVSTAQGVQTNVVSTAQVVQTNVVSTADVARTQVNATVDSAATEIVSTVDAVRTNAFATVEVLRTEAVGTLQAVAEEINDALNVIDINYDREAGTVTLTTTFDENQINEIINVVLEAGGYGEINATVDLVDGGMIVTLEDVTLENGAVVTAVLTFELVETEDGYDLVLTGITVNNFPIPQDQLDAVLQGYIEAYIEDIINGNTSDFADDLPEGAEAVEYVVDQVIITDNLIAVVIIITVSD